jgi:hypothetical protein
MMSKEEYINRYGNVYGYVSETSKNLYNAGTSSIDMTGTRCRDFTVKSFYGRLKKTKGRSASVWECTTDDGLHFLIRGTELRKLIKGELCQN